MNKKSLKMMVAALAVTLVTGALTGCASKGGDNTTGSSNKVSGTITAAGSTALQPLAEQAAKQFMSKNSDATVNVQGGGSGNGLTQVASGSVQIGNSDIFANEKSGLNAADLVDHKVCVVGFAIVVSNGVNVDNLSKQQVIDIFTGKITNWKDVGGQDLKIQVINRPASSGTRATFKKYALDGKDEVQGGTALQEDSSGLVKNTIQSQVGSIGYLALSYLTADVRKDIKVIKYDGNEANKDNITSGKYPIWSYEHMYTKGEAADLTKTFLNYMVSDEVKPLVDKLGYIPISDMKVTR